MNIYSIRRSFFILCFLTWLLLISPMNSDSITDIPQDNLTYPVLLVGKVTGSGFYIYQDGITYLITARHVLFKETSVEMPLQFNIPPSVKHKTIWQKNEAKNCHLLTFYGVMTENERDEILNATPKAYAFDFKKSIETLYNNSLNLSLRDDVITLYSYDLKDNRFSVHELEVQLSKLFKNGQVKYHPSHDVAYVKIGINKIINGKDKTAFFEGVTKKRGAGFSGLDKNNFKPLEDVTVGNQVYVFGYPTSITQINPWLDIKLPLLRKGIVAGKNEELKAIILDCPIYYGDSGGLVIEVDENNGTYYYKAIGIISEFVPFERNWFQNSGYSIVVPMDFVKELLNDQTK